MTPKFEISHVCPWYIALGVHISWIWNECKDSQSMESPISIIKKTLIKFGWNFVLILWLESRAHWVPPYIVSAPWRPLLRQDTVILQKWCFDSVHLYSMQAPLNWECHSCTVQVHLLFGIVSSVWYYVCMPKYFIHSDRSPSSNSSPLLFMMHHPDLISQIWVIMEVIDDFCIWYALNPVFISAKLQRYTSCNVSDELFLC